MLLFSLKRSRRDSELFFRSVDLFLLIGSGPPRLTCRLRRGEPPLKLLESCHVFETEYRSNLTKVFCEVICHVFETECYSSFAKEFCEVICNTVSASRKNIHVFSFKTEIETISVLVSPVMATVM